MEKELVLSKLKLAYQDIESRGDNYYTTRDKLIYTDGKDIYHEIQIKPRRDIEIDHVYAVKIKDTDNSEGKNMLIIQAYSPNHWKVMKYTKNTNTIECILTDEEKRIERSFLLLNPVKGLCYLGANVGTINTYIEAQLLDFRDDRFDVYSLYEIFRHEIEKVVEREYIDIDHEETDIELFLEDTGDRYHKIMCKITDIFTTQEFELGTYKVEELLGLIDRVNYPPLNAFGV